MTKKQILSMNKLETDEQLDRAINILDKLLNEFLSKRNDGKLTSELEKISNLIYEYEERTDIMHRCFQHKQHFVKVGEQAGLIDEELVPLIEKLWEKGIYTCHSCQENKPGIVWIEFQTAWDATQFLNLVSKLPGDKEPWKTMYGRIANFGGDNLWEYACYPENINNLRGEPITKERQKVDFNFFISVRFPRTDLPEVMERLNG